MTPDELIDSPGGSPVAENVYGGVPPGAAASGSSPYRPCRCGCPGSRCCSVVPPVPFVNAAVPLGVPSPVGPSQPVPAVTDRCAARAVGAAGHVEQVARVRVRVGRRVVPAAGLPASAYTPAITGAAALVPPYTTQPERRTSGRPRHRWPGRRPRRRPPRRVGCSSLSPSATSASRRRPSSRSRRPSTRSRSSRESWSTWSACVPPTAVTYATSPGTRHRSRCRRN